MAQLHYSTQENLGGPWLLEMEALLKLDSIISKGWGQLEARRNQLINEGAEKSLANERDQGLLKDFSEEQLKTRLEELIAEPKYPLLTEVKELRVFLDDGARFEVADFKSAEENDILINFVPTGFEYEIKSADIRCNILLDRRLNELKIEVKPEEFPESKNFFMGLRNWAKKYSAPSWQKFWVQRGGAQWLIWLIVLVISIVFILIQSTNVTNVAKSRAMELLDNGISPFNLPEAIELLLILETNYDPSGQISLGIPTWLIVVFFVGMFICVLLSITPKTILGFGKGQDRINKWQAWIKFVGVTFPTLIFGSVIWPYIENLIKKYALGP